MPKTHVTPQFRTAFPSYTSKSGKGKGGKYGKCKSGKAKWGKAKYGKWGKAKGGKGGKGYYDDDEYYYYYDDDDKTTKRSKAYDDHYYYDDDYDCSYDDYYYSSDDRCSREDERKCCKGVKYNFYGYDPQDVKRCRNLGCNIQYCSRWSSPFRDGRAEETQDETSTPAISEATGER